MSPSHLIMKKFIYVQGQFFCLGENERNNFSDQKIKRRRIRIPRRNRKSSSSLDNEKVHLRYDVFCNGWRVYPSNFPQCFFWKVFCKQRKMIEISRRSGRIWQIMSPPPFTPAIVLLFVIVIMYSLFMYAGYLHWIYLVIQYILISLLVQDLSS